MSKPKTDKEWQERNPDKAKLYTQKYMQGKKHVTLTLNLGTLAAIDQVKPPQQQYAAWIKNFLEEWENVHNTI